MVVRAALVQLLLLVAFALAIPRPAFPDGGGANDGTPSLNLLDARATPAEPPRRTTPLQDLVLLESHDRPHFDLEPARAAERCAAQARAILATRRFSLRKLLTSLHVPRMEAGDPPRA